jgi:cyclopropane fatty-acyl-phospholipid synthase-like methyltransferase
VTTISAADFEARYRVDPDPWNYASSAYERSKYAATLAACGAGPFACALELAGSIGVFSAMLAPRCERLLTVDVAPSAVRQARGRLAGFPQARAMVGSVPYDVPAARYDLVVASEILYYLSQQELDDTLAMFERNLAAGGLLVAVHWRPAGPERPRDADQAHAALRALPFLSPLRCASTEDYLLEVFRR